MDRKLTRSIAMQLNSKQARIFRKIIRATNTEKKYYHIACIGIKAEDERFLTPRFKEFLKAKVRERGYTRIKFWKHTKRDWDSFRGHLVPGTRQAVSIERKGIEQGSFPNETREMGDGMGVGREYGNQCPVGPWR